jgi:integrase
MLRHVYASLRIEHGVTPKRLQKLIGHATLKMTLATYGPTLTPTVTVRAACRTFCDRRERIRIPLASAWRP